MMNEHELMQLDLAELNELSEKIDNVKAKKREEEIAAARQEVQKRAEELGVSMAELFGKKTKKAKSQSTAPAAPPKYRNPDNATETWSGRGRPPKWFVEKETAGFSRDDMLIDKR